MLIKFVFATLLLLQVSSFAASAGTQETLLPAETQRNISVSSTATPAVAEPDTKEMILMGLSLMGLIAVRRKASV